MSLIAVTDIWKSYGGPDILQGVSLSVSAGERVALLGRNGCGKSTLLQIITGHVLPDRGKVQLTNRARIGYLTQDLSEIGSQNALSEASLGLGDMLRLEKQLEELAQELETAGDNATLLRRYERVVLEFEHRGGYTWQERVRAVLMGLGLRPDGLHLSAAELSGGERMRVALARLLLQEPDLLLLDEPTNHLDLTATQWLEGFLRSFSGACLVVSHDRYFLDAVATRCVEMDDGKVELYPGGYSDYAREKARRAAELQHDTARFQHRVRQEEAQIAQLKQMRRITQAASRGKALARLQANAPEKQRREQVLGITLTQPEWVSKSIATAKNLEMHFGTTKVLNSISFDIAGGERVGIVGPNGSGKTTLLRLLLGWIEPTAGEVQMGAWVRWGILEQEPHFAFPDRTVLEELLSTSPSLQQAEAQTLLAKFLFYGETVYKPVSALSGGERSRLALLCLLQSEPHCLVLDEPTNHLDIASRECLEEALLSFRGTVIAVSHDRFFLNRVVNRIMELRDGKLKSYPGNYTAYQKALVLGQASLGDLSGKKRLGTVAVTGKQAAKQGASFNSSVRQKSKERQLDLAKEIATAQKRLGELEASFQNPGFYRQRDSHQYLLEHQQLMEHLAELLAAKG